MLADAYGWQYGFLTYLFPIRILAVTILYLPEPEKKDHSNSASVEGQKKVKMPKAVYWTVLAQVFYSALIFGNVTNISVVIQADNLEVQPKPEWVFLSLHLVPTFKLCVWKI